MIFDPKGHKVYFIAFRESPDHLKDIPSTCMVRLLLRQKKD